MVKGKTLNPIGTGTSTVREATSQPLQDILTQDYPDDIKKLIDRLIFKFPVSIDLSESYQKVGYVVKVAYDILSKTQPLPEDYNFENNFNDLLIAKTLPKDEEELEQYITRKFRVQSNKDFKNLWLLLSTLTDLIYGDAIQSFYTARNIIHARIGTGKINLTNAVGSLTELVQRSTISGYEEQKGVLQAEVAGLESKISELRQQEGNLRKITQLLENAKQEYEKLRQAAAEVTWENRTLSPNSITTTSKQLVDEIRNMAGVLMNEKSLSFEEALREVEFHNRALFVQTANEYVPKAFGLAEEQYNAVNALIAMNDIPVTNIFDIRAPISFLFPKVVYPQSHDEIVHALREQAQLVKDQTRLENENNRLREETKELEKKQKALSDQLAPMQQTYAAIEERFQEYLGAATTVEWVEPNSSHPIWDCIYTFANFSGPQELKNALIQEYMFHMKVNKEIATTVIQQHCGVLFTTRKLDSDSIKTMTFPVYHFPKFTIDDLKQGLVPANTQPEQELDQESTPQEMLDQAMRLIAQARTKMAEQYGPAPTTDEKAM